MIRPEKNFDYFEPKGKIYLGYSKVHKILILGFWEKGVGS